MQLTLIPSMSKGFQIPVQPVETTREAPAAAGQPGQVVAQLGIVAFNGVCLALIKQGQMIASTIAQTIIQRELVAVILCRPGLIDHLLPHRPSALKNSLNTQKAARCPVDNSHDVGFVFL